ncbi:hypothetical protein niasHT_035686 [Heterodera trifolii]|uniref:RNA-dependent RNA polymerase n=1 Tax=Heterodera trifolii TaxID=157864 RepID=A0ABD2HUE2_9BILA
MPPHVAPDERQIREFRTKLGSFEIQSAPKMMSRLAQCFTQASETGIELERRFYATSFDYLGGRDSKDEPYCFSDGVGRISFETARELSRELKLEDCTLSCYQIRFRGFKGVLSVDKNLDALREWGRLDGIKDNTVPNKSDCWLDLKITFRLSQNKFKTQREARNYQVKKAQGAFSFAGCSQVSALLSEASHQRIAIESIYCWTSICMRSLILYDEIRDLNLTKEPFFRSMVSASVRASLRKLRMKLQIPIPSSLVFIRYTKNCALKLPGATAERQVLTGPVMITKNPSIVAGDIRMFTAVDIPALLCEVVVFPRYGPRPHTDEIADEFAVQPKLRLDITPPDFGDFRVLSCLLRGVEAEAVNEEDLEDSKQKFWTILKLRPSQPPSFVSPVGPSTNKSTPAQGGHVNIHTPTRGTRGMEALASSTPFSTEPDPSVRPPGTDQGTTQEGIRRARQKTSTEPSSIGICNAVLTNDK